MKSKLKQILTYVIPFIAFALIFGFSLACVTSPEEEIGKAIEEEIIGVKEAKVTTESIKAKGEYISLGESVEYDDLKVTVTDCISMDSYESEYYGTEYPEEGAKFIWICVKAENIGKQEKWLPGCDEFSLLYIDSLISFEGGILGSPSSVNKEGYDSESVMPGISREGWILYEIPKDAKAEDILIALECDYDKYYYWEIPEPLKEIKSEPRTKEEEQVKETLLALGQAVEYEGLRVSIIKYEFAEWIKTKYDPIYPEEGAKYLWIYVKAENIGEVEKELPGYWSFYILYKATEIGPHKWDADYSVDHQLYPGGYVYPSVGKEGWILSDLPAGVKAEDIMVRLYDSRISPNGECIWKLK